MSWGDVSVAVVDELRVDHIDDRRLPWARPSGWVSRYVRTALVADFACSFSACLIALFGRFPDVNGRGVLPYQVLSVLLPFCWIAAVAIARGYEPRFIGVGSEEFRRVFNAGVTLIAAVAFVSYASKTDLARGYVVVALPLAIFLDLLARYALRRRLHWRRGRGECMSRVVAVGHPDAVADLIRMFRREVYHGMDVVAACTPDGSADGGTLDGVPVLGDLADAAGVVDRAAADAVAVLACPEMDGATLRRLAWRLEKTATELCVAPALMDVAGPRTTIRPIAGLPLLHVEHPELAGGKRLVKSLVDRAGALLAMMVLSPAFLAIAAAVKVTDRGPVLFRQTRVGRSGTEFTVLKFRTMVPDAELRRAELTLRNEHDGVLFKIKDDPRITPVGHWLRRNSLDELPQLINVLFGEMSLVGPRPPLPEEVAQYGDDVRRRLVVKPGITGLWQISGRADLSWEESVRLDLRYVENWSLTLDLQILWKTIGAVMRGSGAY